jgi:hypothetical protein
VTLRPLVAALFLPTLACGELGERQPPSFRTVASARELNSETSLTVNVEFQSGRFQLTPAQESTLYRTKLVYDESRFEPVNRYRAADQLLEIGTDGSNLRGDVDLDPESGQFLDLALSPAVPVSVSLRLGVVNAAIELGGLSLERIDLKIGASQTTVGFDAPNRVRCSDFSLTTGAADLRVVGLGNARCDRVTVTGGVGDVTLDFTGDWQADQSSRVDVKLGVGALTLRFPKGLGVEIELGRLLASFEALGLVRIGDRFVSEDYDTATNRVRLAIKTAFGDIRVVWVE